MLPMSMDAKLMEEATDTLYGVVVVVTVVVMAEGALRALVSAVALKLLVCAVMVASQQLAARSLQLDT